MLVCRLEGASDDRTRKGKLDKSLNLRATATMVDEFFQNFSVLKVVKTWSKKLIAVNETKGCGGADLGFYNRGGGVKNHI